LKELYGIADDYQHLSNSFTMGYVSVARSSKIPVCFFEPLSPSGASSFSGHTLDHPNKHCLLLKWEFLHALTALFLLQLDFGA